MRTLGEKAFYSIFLIHFIVVLYIAYANAYSDRGISLWISAGIGFSCGFMQIYAPKNIIKSLLIAVAPVTILFLVYYFCFQDFRILTEAQRNSTNLFSRSLSHISQLNYTVFNNFKTIFIRETLLTNWLGLLFSFFLARFISSYALKQIYLKEESKFNDGSILNKRYESKSYRFKRRF